MASQAIFRTIREQIVEQLRKEVISGELKNGEPLREQTLAKRFGVSRGPVRDALLQLTQEGLLISEPNQGVKVGYAPSTEIHSLIIELRQHIETFALSSIFEQITEEDIQHWEEIVERLRVACEQEDIPAVVEHDMALHRAIVERADSKDLLAIWLPIVARMMLRYSRHSNLMESYIEHRTIIEAIRLGHKQAALEALKANIQ